jgi:hypothetical protein
MTDSRLIVTDRTDDERIDHPQTAEDHALASAAWADGRRSGWNWFAYDMEHGHERCAVHDSARAAAHAAAAFALAAVR